MFLTDKIKMMKYQPKLNNKKKCTPSLYWVIPEKAQAGGLRIWNFQDSGIKNNVEFPGYQKKNYMEFPEVLIFGVLEFPSEM